MAKASIRARNKKRNILAKRASAKRDNLKEIIRVDEENRDDALLSLQKMKRDTSPIRLRNRCRQCGRGKGTLRKFGLCRIHLREAAMKGLVPGVRKASW